MKNYHEFYNTIAHFDIVGTANKNSLSHMKNYFIQNSYDSIKSKSSACASLHAYIEGIYTIQCELIDIIVEERQISKRLSEDTAILKKLDAMREWIPLKHRWRAKTQIYKLNEIKLKIFWIKK